MFGMEYVVVKIRITSYLREELETNNKQGGAPLINP
jgi:hypothetical protein